MHVQLNVCFKHLRNIQFFPNPLFIVCSVLQDGTENASRKVARKNRMRAGERRVLKIEPLRIDCLPFTWANLSVHGLGKW